jgi:hypothetical protein
LDRWQARTEKAGKLVTWHPVDLPVQIHKQIAAKAIDFAQARRLLAGGQNDSILELAAALRVAAEAVGETKGKR